MRGKKGRQGRLGRGERRELDERTGCSSRRWRGVCMAPTSLRTSGLSDGSEDMKGVRTVSPWLSPPLLVLLCGCVAASSLEVAQPMTTRTTRRRKVWRCQKDGAELEAVMWDALASCGITRPCPPPRITRRRGTPFFAAIVCDRYTCTPETRNRAGNIEPLLFAGD